MKVCGHCREEYGPENLPRPDTYGRSKFCGMDCYRRSKRTSFVVIGADYCEIHMADRRVAMVSREDADLVASRSWSIGFGGYVAAGRVRLHRLILGSGAGMVDHINRNKLDNRRDNLRLTDGTVNGLNRSGARRDSTSGVRGVMWNRQRGKYEAEIRIRGRHIHLGRFDTIEEATVARRAAEAEFWSTVL